MKKVLNIITYEWRKIIFDFSAVTILFAGAMIYSLYYPFPYSHEIVRNMPIGIVDKDHSDLSKKLISMIDSSENIAVNTYPSIDAAKEAFYAREIYGIIDIPYNFYKSVVLGQSPTVTLFSDASYLIFYSTALSAATQTVLTVAAGAKIEKMSMAGIPFRDALKLQSTANLTPKPLYNPKGGYASYVSPAIYTLIVQQVLLIVMLLIQGTSYENGYRYPKGSTVLSILFGKILAYFPIFLIIFAYFFTIGPMVYNIPVFNNIFECTIFIIPYGLSIILFAISCSYFAREREGVLLVMLMTAIPFLMIAGYIWPHWMMPDFINYISKFIPSTAGMTGFVFIRQMGANVSDVLPQYINLWCLVLLYSISSIFAIKWQLKQPNSINITE